MIFERLSLSFIALIACLVSLETPAVKVALANASDSAGQLRPLCGFGEATGH